MALYLLLVLVGTLPLALLAAGAYALYRAWRRTALRTARFEVVPRTAKPGQRLIARAHVVPRRQEPLWVGATLRCTLFDHRSRRLFAKTVALPITAGAEGRESELFLPETALRTGVIGDELSSLFSEEARRLMAFWTVVFEVRRDGAKGTLLARKSLSIDVPEGRPLSTEAAWMGEVVVETFAALKDDLLFNWMVRMAARDGAIHARERDLLHEVLKSAHEIADPAAADARIEHERHRELDIDPEMLRRHVPVEHRIHFYKLMFSLAWRDGKLDAREHEILKETLEAFGLDKHHVREVELEVLRGMAAHSLS